MKEGKTNNKLAVCYEKMVEKKEFLANQVTTMEMLKHEYKFTHNLVIRECPHMILLLEAKVIVKTSSF